ncbi:MAG: hypothetical protein HQ402_03160 [Parcubacteria group bacterium]|nr:hypothetical protein [Parcubacteria group bacterium]
MMKKIGKLAKKRKKAICYWYVEPLNAHTNEVIGKNLDPNEDCENLLCADGEHRNLWRCAYPFVARIQKSKASLKLIFKVFNQEGSHGRIRPWISRKRK